MILFLAAAIAAQATKPTLEELKAKTAAITAAVDAENEPKPAPVNGKVIGAYKVGVSVDNMSDEKTVEIVTRPTVRGKADIFLSFSCNTDGPGIQFLYNFDRRLLTTHGYYEFRLRVDQNKMIEFKATPTRDDLGGYVELDQADFFATPKLSDQLQIGSTLRIQVISRDGTTIDRLFSLKGFVLAVRTLPCVE